MDLTQLLANAFAGAFGMGMANELYHAFVDYRKKLKERLLDETMAAINYYRRNKAYARALAVPRHANTPFSARHYQPKVTAMPVELKATPVVATPVRHAHPWNKQKTSFYFGKPPLEPTPVIASKQDQDTPAPISYKIPEKPEDRSLDVLTGKLVNWENA